MRYLDPQWAGFYDILKVINDDLIIGRVYARRAIPNGPRMFTFAMTRRYGFEQMTVGRPRAVVCRRRRPHREGARTVVWRMDIICNNNHLARAAYLEFELKPDGRLASHYQFLGPLRRPGAPQLHAGPFPAQRLHAVPRRDPQGGRQPVGRPVRYRHAARSRRPVQRRDLGILHTVPGTQQFGFYYTLSRAGQSALPTGGLLAPFLDAQLPDGVGMSFDEDDDRLLLRGCADTRPGREGDLTIAARIPASGQPAGAVPCSFQAHMMVRDVNEFIDGAAHEAEMSGTISFGRFDGADNVTLAMNEDATLFHYLIVNPDTREAEMRYHIEFTSAAGKAYVFEGRKYMQKDSPVGSGTAAAITDLLGDYTTLYCHVYRRQGARCARRGRHRLSAIQDF